MHPVIDTCAFRIVPPDSGKIRTAPSGLITTSMGCPDCRFIVIVTWLALGRYPDGRYIIVDGLLLPE